MICGKTKKTKVILQNFYSYYAIQIQLSKLFIHSKSKMLKSLADCILEKPITQLHYAVTHRFMKSIM